MPTYEYACKQCDEHFDVVQSFTDDPLTVCPTCGGDLRKVFGNVGIVFKGSGFYKTDSRSASSSVKPSEPSATKADSDSKPTDSKPTDSKPADAKPADSKPADAKPGSSSPSSGSSAGAGSGTKTATVAS